MEFISSSKLWDNENSSPYMGFVLPKTCFVYIIMLKAELKKFGGSWSEGLNSWPKFKVFCIFLYFSHMPVGLTHPTVNKF